MIRLNFKLISKKYFPFKFKFKFYLFHFFYINNFSNRIYMSEGKLLVDDFSFDREFNQSVATKIIVKQRILKDWYIFNTKHSETYFISKDG